MSVFRKKDTFSNLAMHLDAHYKRSVSVWNYRTEEFTHQGASMELKASMDYIAAGYY